MVEASISQPGCGWQAGCGAARGPTPGHQQLPRLCRRSLVGEALVCALSKLPQAVPRASRARNFSPLLSHSPWRPPSTSRPRQGHLLVSLSAAATWLPTLGCSETHRSGAGRVEEASRRNRGAAFRKFSSPALSGPRSGWGPRAGADVLADACRLSHLLSARTGVTNGVFGKG